MIHFKNLEEIPRPLNDKPLFPLMLLFLHISTAPSLMKMSDKKGNDMQTTEVL